MATRKRNCDDDSPYPSPRRQKVDSEPAEGPRYQTAPEPAENSAITAAEGVVCGQHGGDPGDRWTVVPPGQGDQGGTVYTDLLLDPSEFWAYFPEFQNILPEGNAQVGQDALFKKLPPGLLLEQKDNAAPVGYEQASALSNDGNTKKEIEQLKEKTQKLEEKTQKAEEENQELRDRTERGQHEIEKLTSEVERLKGGLRSEVKGFGDKFEELIEVVKSIEARPDSEVERLKGELRSQVKGFGDKFEELMEVVKGIEARLDNCL